MNVERRLPIKVILDQKGERQQNPQGGSPRKMFGDVTPEVREKLINQLQNFESYFKSSFQKWPKLPVVGKINLKRDALAKTHRPSSLFGKKSIIGIGKLGEIHISLNPMQIVNLKDHISQDDSFAAKANISTIETIEPYRIEKEIELSLRKMNVNRHGRLEGVLKLNLFQHGDAELNLIVLETAIDFLADMNVEVEEVPYSSKLTILKLMNVPSNGIKDIREFAGARNLSAFPEYRIINPTAIKHGIADLKTFPPPNSSTEIPIMGIIDTGTDPDDPFLDPWIISRDNYVPKYLRNYEHGRAVAGLAINARSLNGNDPRFPDMSAYIRDVVALPKNGSIREDELLSLLEEVLSKHKDVKYWNLSLSSDEVCSNDCFSDFGTNLDELQDEFGVRFVVSAGNYGTPPFRRWPLEQNLGEGDRVTSPGDSVRAITVGSLAHRKNNDSRVNIDDPSPFSRRGPGGVYHPKPEVTHFGGNCNSLGNYLQSGIVSTIGNSSVGEQIGTSFSTPIITSLLANVQHSFADDYPTILSKALLIHSAALESGPMDTHNLKYRGFGKPSDPLDCLSCPPWMATMVIQSHMSNIPKLVKQGFPIPHSIQSDSGINRAIFLMTLVYDPPIDPRFGSEYCRSNLDAHLGIVKSDGKFVSQVPSEPSDKNKLYARYVVENSFKWSPVKVYRREVKRGIKGKNWKLWLNITNRDGFDPVDPIDFTLIISIIDPDKKAPVYDEVVQAINRIGWNAVDLKLRDEVQVRIR